MNRCRFALVAACLGFLSADTLSAGGANAQEPPASLTAYKPLPTKEIKLDAKALERVLSAKTVTVLAGTVPLFRRQSGEPGIIVTYRGGRVGPEKAKADVMKVLAEWGAFSLLDDPAQADLVMVIQEQTLAPSYMSNGNVRLKDTLAVFSTGGPGAAPPLWVGIDTENALAAGSGLTTPDAEGVVEKFRRAVEEAKKRIKR
jgi:hypothetical protein